LAASVAFGNVTTIRAKLDDALRRLGPSPSAAAEDESGMFARLDGWIHRVYQGEDIARLLLGARRLQTKFGSLGSFFAAEYTVHGSLREAMASLCDALRSEGGFPMVSGKGAVAVAVAEAAERAATATATATAAAQRRGPAHLLPDPRGKSGSKRMLLFLRWMIRPADGVDLGLWPLPPRVLRCPVDTHIHKLARNLGLTDRKDMSWATTEEITEALARFDPNDPVKYDFSLCHLGMLQRCPSRKDPEACAGCPVMPVCRHWSPRKGARRTRPAGVGRDQGG
jgi:uncharacterized protein (TIGR02757 family)